MAEPPADLSALQAELDTLDARVERADEVVRLALYLRYKGEPGPDVAAAEEERAALLLDDGLAATLRAWADRPTPEPTRRRLDLWRKLSTAARVRDVAPIRDLRTELNAAVVRYRPLVAGSPTSRTAVREILRADPDRDRRHAAWLSFAPLSLEVEARTRELLDRRNAEARQLGFPGYVALSLQLDGLSRPEVEDLFDYLDEATRAPYERLLKAGAARQATPGEAVEPWDVALALNRSYLVPDERFPREAMPDRLEAYRRRIGVPDGLPIRLEFVEVPFQGLTNFIKIPSDIRILMNAAASHSYYVTLFHEYGHAIHNASIAQRSFILQKESGPYSESMAQVSAYFASHPSWLAETSGMKRDEFAAFAEARLAAWLLRIRGLLASASFERAAYDDPDADLDAALAAAEARYLLVRPHPEARRWAADPFYATYPIYLHNYLVADVVASQVHAALRRDLGEPYGNPDTFVWLKERFYARGASIPWRSLVSEATGSDLDARLLAADLRRLEERLLLSPDG